LAVKSQDSNSFEATLDSLRSSFWRRRTKRPRAQGEDDFDDSADDDSSDEAAPGSRPGSSTGSSAASGSDAESGGDDDG
jgi:hypothetical protein